MTIDDPGINEEEVHKCGHNGKEFRLSENCISIKLLLGPITLNKIEFKDKDQEKLKPQNSTDVVRFVSFGLIRVLRGFIIGSG